MYGQAPYRAVLTHGFTVDADGRKMSKSLGNVVSPQAVMKTLGADIIRLWVAATDYRNEMSVSDEILKRMSDAYRRIRNTGRYLLANLHDFDPASDLVEPARMLPLDRWALDRAWQLQEEIRQAYADYQFHLIYQRVHNFCVTDMGGFYLDVTKDRQYTCQANSLARRSAQSAMYHIIEAFARWLAPILSFTAEEIWGFIPGKREASVFLAGWHQGLVPLDAGKPSRDDWAGLLELRLAVAKLLEEQRKAGAIGSSLDAEIDLYADEQIGTLLAPLGDELRFLLISSQARVHGLAAAPATAQATGMAGLRVSIAASAAPKCVRCWHHRPEVGSHAQHPELCGRCVENIEGAGETRSFG
jgi:isoleucyl-tRNA synthetase